MKTRTRRAAFVVLGACATAACSFAVDLEGLTSPPSILAPAEAGEAGEAAVLVEASVDAPLDAPADAPPPSLPAQRDHRHAAHDGAGPVDAPHGGLWHAALPLRAFDIELEAHVRCTAAYPCADGLGLVWLDTLDIPAAWHSLTVSLRGDTVGVGYDGVFWIIGLVRPITRGVVGLTAGTGGQTNAVAVRNVKGAFYDCTP